MSMSTKASDGIQAATIEKTKLAFGGKVLTCAHKSSVLGCDMKFTMFWPREAELSSALNPSGTPVVFYLSGLTCNHENFITKGCAIETAANLNICLVCPDTSPRGDHVPDAPDTDECKWDFGKGAGFYVDATEKPYSQNYKMYSYIVDELPRVVEATCQDASTSVRSLARSPAGIMGHSMGGHGALMIALKNAGKFSSASAFAPICNPASGNCPWGDKCFGRYLGSVEDGKAYDATELAKAYDGPSLDVLVHQGTEDCFYKTQLQTKNFEDVAKVNPKINASVVLATGYDHSYYFVSTFMKQHIRFHAERLHKKA